MMSIIELITNPYTQAIFWLICTAFSIYFAIRVRSMSFGEDTGTKAWIIITFALFTIGLRVSFKVIFPDYESSYILQLVRFSLGIVGIILLYMGFKSLQSALRRMTGVLD
jgi:hypothetical protein